VRRVMGRWSDAGAMPRVGNRPLRRNWAARAPCPQAEQNLTRTSGLGRPGAGRWWGVRKETTVDGRHGPRGLLQARARRVKHRGHAAPRAAEVAVVHGARTVRYQVVSHHTGVVFNLLESLPTVNPSSSSLMRGLPAWVKR